MGEESVRAGSDLPNIRHDSVESTPDSPQSGGVAVQHLPDSGEGGTEGEIDTSVVSVGPEEPGKEATSDYPTSGGLGWSIVQLTELAELVPVQDVERDLRRILDKNIATMFFPAVSRAGSFVKDNPYANYVFVASAAPDSKVLKLEGSRFVDSVLCVPGSAGRWRTVSKITDEELWVTYAQQQADSIPDGTEVKVTSGEWNGLTGTLISTFGNQVRVSLQLRSRRRILVLAREEITRA